MVTLVFSTFWTQDVFDFLMAEKIKDMKIIAQKNGDKEAINVIKQLGLIKFTPMNPTQTISNMAVRAIIIASFLIVSSIIQWTNHSKIATFIELTSQSLLIAYYCFEYKTAAACLDTTTSLNLFEKQWVY